MPSKNARHRACYNERWYRRLLSEVKASGALCAMCREKPADTLNHIVPLAAGGDHVPENLEPACRSCNSRGYPPAAKPVDPRVAAARPARNALCTCSHPVLRVCALHWTERL